MLKMYASHATVAFQIKACAETAYVAVVSVITGTLVRFDYQKQQLP